MVCETMAKSANYQNSDRLARPLKSTYFRKHILMDSMKVMAP